MVVLRRHMEGICLNPYEYMLNDEGDLLNFKNQQQAVEFCKERGLDVEDGEDLWNKYGIECHEIDKAQFAQVSKDIKQNQKEEE